MKSACRFWLEIEGLKKIEVITLKFWKSKYEIQNSKLINPKIAPENLGFKQGIRKRRLRIEIWIWNPNANSLLFGVRSRWLKGWNSKLNVRFEVQSPNSMNWGQKFGIDILRTGIRARSFLKVWARRLEFRSSSSKLRLQVQNSNSKFPGKIKIFNIEIFAARA